VRGSAKGLWTSTINLNAQNLVITESPIDGLSYFTLFPDLQKSGVVFASVSGGLRPHQVQLIINLIKRLPQLQKIILAVDHDKGGEKIEKTIREGIKNLRVFFGDMLTHVPEKMGDDWNEVLKNREQK
jgi:DNA primase